MCYHCLSNGNGSSWSSFEHNIPGSRDWSRKARVIEERGHSDEFAQYYSYASMAAGSPLSDAWD